MGIFLCYLGVQAAHSYIYCTSVRRVCIHWFISAIIWGSLGLILSKGGHSDGWIPINKNLWSLTFVLVVASLSYIILIIFSVVVDICQWLTGAPFVWLGMNSIFIYVIHILLKRRFPIYFRVEETHAKVMAMNLYGVFFWTFIAGLMYWKKFFIVV
jgi:heparan-alpha-glucosaminide N-acetyltransferase